MMLGRIRASPIYRPNLLDFLELCCPKAPLLFRHPLGASRYLARSSKLLELCMGPVGVLNRELLIDISE